MVSSMMDIQRRSFSPHSHRFVHCWQMSGMHEPLPVHQALNPSFLNLSFFHEEIEAAGD